MEAKDGVDFLWNTGETTRAILVDSGTYDVLAHNSKGCESRDTIKVDIISMPNIKLLPTHDTLLCSYDSITLATNMTVDSYLWPDNSTGNTFKVKQPGGLIRFKYTSQGCAGSDSARINFQAPFITNLGKDTSTCTGIQIILDAGNAQTYLWNTGSASRTIQVGTIGWYSVKTTDTLGCKAHDSVFVDVTCRSSCESRERHHYMRRPELVLDAKVGAYFVWNTGQNSQSILVDTTGNYHVFARDSKGCEGRDTIQVNVVEMPVFKLGNDTILCDNDSALFTINVQADAYNWNTGSNNPSLWINTTGTFIGRAINQNLCLCRYGRSPTRLTPCSKSWP